MSKHTPGPWIVDRQPHGAGFIRRIRSVVGDRMSRNSVAEIGSQFLNADVVEANARLIAVAPEMLEALEECFNVLTEPGIMDVDEWKAWKREAEIKAHAAITKARGES